MSEFLKDVTPSNNNNIPNQLEIIFKINKTTNDDPTRTTEDDNPIDAVSWTCAVWLDRFEERVLTTCSHSTEEEKTDVFVIAFIKNHSAEHPDLK